MKIKYNFVLIFLFDFTFSFNDSFYYFTDSLEILKNNKISQKEDKPYGITSHNRREKYKKNIKFLTNYKSKFSLKDFNLDPFVFFKVEELVTYDSFKLELNEILGEENKSDNNLSLENNLEQTFKINIPKKISLIKLIYFFKREERKFYGELIKLLEEND